METEFIFLVGAVILQCLTFGIAGYVKAKIESNEPFNWIKLGVTLIYSVTVAGIVISAKIVDINTLGSFIENPSVILNPIWIQYFFIFTGIQYAINKLLDPVLSTKILPLFSDGWVLANVPDLSADELKAQGMLPAGVPYYRKMNEDRRHNMVFDQPQYMQQPILDCVDTAESKTTWRYAIQAGAWVYLIEYGVQTGAKHYWFWRSGAIEWKPITVDCLEKIRKTGKFPEYSQLT